MFLAAYSNCKNTNRCYNGSIQKTQIDKDTFTVYAPGAKSISNYFRLFIYVMMTLCNLSFSIVYIYPKLSGNDDPKGDPQPTALASKSN